MLSCKTASLLIEKKSIVGLSFKERIQLGMHKLVCDACRAFEKQNKYIDEWFQKFYFNPASAQNKHILNNSLKEKINKLLG